MIIAEETQYNGERKFAPLGFWHDIVMSCEYSLYQLGYVVDDNQVGPGISEAEVCFIINSTQLANSAHKKHTTQEQTMTFSCN